MDFSDLLTPITPEAPSGPDPDDDSAFPALNLAFNQLDSMASGELKDGVLVPPRWPAVAQVAHDLARQTKHLRIAVILTEAGCANEGIPGLRDGLQLIKVWVTGYWDSLHPALERHIVLASLNHSRFLVSPRRVVLTSGLGGRFSYEDYEKAKDIGPDNADMDRANEARLILGTFAETPRDVHARNLAAARDALAAANEIETFFDDKARADGGVNFSDLRDLLAKVIKLLEPLAEVPAPAEEATAAQDGGVAASAPGQGKAGDGVVNSRQSAAAMLERVAKYFETAEPSSPIPYLVRRAQRCIGKSFMDLIGELSMDSAKAVDILSPPASQKSEAEN